MHRIKDNPDRRRLPSPKTFRFYTKVDSMKHIIIALDITKLDYRLSSLELYVSYWFTDLNDLIDHVTNTNETSFILITSNLLNHFEPDNFIELFPQISDVYMLGNGWRWDFRKKGIYGPFSDAVSLLEHLVPRFTTTDMLNHKSFAKEQSVNHLKEYQYKYTWFRIFFQLLSCLKKTKAAREELLTTIRNFHEDRRANKVEQNCEEFIRDYQREDVIQWYLRTAFFYISLNRSLRSEEINQIFRYRYVISDLNASLQNLRQSEAIEIYPMVYRGQHMYQAELNSIIKKKGDMFVLTSFWSATKYREQALLCLTASDHHTSIMVNVVMCIKIPSNFSRRPYVDLSDYTSTPRLQSLIFPLHSLFRVEHAEEHADLWTIFLTLVDESDSENFQTIDSLALKVGTNSFFTESTNQRIFLEDLAKENGPFIRFQLLIDMILRLDRNDFSKLEMFEMCRTEFSTSPTALDQIETLENEYDSRDAVKWYTKTCFLYRLLNQSLRESHIDLIVKLRHFIYDLHNQLVELQIQFFRSLQTGNSTLTLYRGSLLNKNEFERFRQHQNHYVSMNSFLSTTQDYQAALFFSGEGKTDTSCLSIIYEIFVDLSIRHSVPFAAIDYQSVFKDEDEVLFSIGAIFHIGTIENIGERIWKIQLTLTPAAEGQWNVFTQHLKKSH